VPVGSAASNLTITLSNVQADTLQLEFVRGWFGMCNLSCIGVRKIASELNGTGTPAGPMTWSNDLRVFLVLHISRQCLCWATNVATTDLDSEM
jgi:hypothetical protein